ncbi:hypothetical protein DPMN_092889 [Dreissena polymorpha]|uniref:Uncharacterized protein n=1 Tax=Dreissena polymorpha TaxID=45954 RepID=A0A9D4L2B9_DREPO|nr:hypothetical protein DPMN_092889 [Dreissena polymorpha]
MIASQLLGLAACCDVRFTTESCDHQHIIFHVLLKTSPSDFLSVSQQGHYITDFR